MLQELVSLMTEKICMSCDMFPVIFQSVTLITMTILRCGLFYLNYTKITAIKQFIFERGWCVSHPLILCYWWMAISSHKDSMAWQPLVDQTVWLSIFIQHVKLLTLFHLHWYCLDLKICSWMCLALVKSTYLLRSIEIFYWYNSQGLWSDIILNGMGKTNYY